MYETHSVSKHAAVGSCQSFMLPTVGSLEEHSNGHVTGFVKKLLVELKSWSKPEMRTAGSYQHPQESREAVVLVETSSWGHQTQSRTRFWPGETWYGRGKDCLLKAGFTAETSVTLRDIYQSRGRGEPSPFLPSSCLLPIPLMAQT